MKRAFNVNQASLTTQLETSVAIARALRDARLAEGANVVPAEKLPTEEQLDAVHLLLDEIIWRYWSGAQQESPNETNLTPLESLIT